MKRISQFLNKTSSLVQAAMASISFFLVSLLLSSLYTMGTVFWLDKGSFGLLPIKVDRLNSPVGCRSLSEAEDGGVGEVEVGLGLVSFSADFLKLIMLFRPSEDTCSLKMWARRLKRHRRIILRGLELQCTFIFTKNHRARKPCPGWIGSKHLSLH